jgi:hypothetical protein
MMGNHFHLIVETMRPNLSEFMRRFNICYTGWFNYRHDRCGHLYQGRYKAILIDVDAYLLQVTRYVHLNPARQAGIERLHLDERWRYAQTFEWSSLPGYIRESGTTDLVNHGKVLGMIGGRRAYRDFVEEGLRQGAPDPMNAVRYQVLLGSDDFVARVRAEHVTAGSTREQGSYRELTEDGIQPSEILRVVSGVCGTEVTAIKRWQRVGVVRGIAAELLYKYSGMTQAEIGRLLGGIDYGAVYQLRQRLRTLIQKDSRALRQYEQAERRIREM